AYEGLVKHQHAQRRRRAPLAHDARERVARAAVRAQLLVHAAHEAVEVGAALAVAALARPPRAGRAGQGVAADLAQRQSVEEQVDQEGLAPPYPAPQIQDDGPGGSRIAEHPTYQAPPRPRRRHRYVPASESGHTSL